MTIYKVISQGIQAEQEPKQVVLRLSRLLKKPPKQLLPLLKKTVVLKQTKQLELAKKYQAAILKTGLKCRIQTTPADNNSTSIPLKPKPAAQPKPQQKLRACPKCGHIQAPANECGQCGIIFERYEARLAAQATEEQQALDSEVIETETQALPVKQLGLLFFLLIVGLAYYLNPSSILQDPNITAATTHEPPEKTVETAAQKARKVRLQAKLKEILFLPPEHLKEHKKQWFAASINQEIQAKAKALFASEDFAAIDALADQYRSEVTRAKSGYWYLLHLHVGLDFDSKNKDAGYWQQAEETVQRWLSFNPDSIIAPIVLAELYHSKAWASRGRGLTNVTAAEQALGFRDYSRQAYDILLQYREQSRFDPQWHTLLLNLKLQRNEAEIMANLKQGVAQEAQYFQMYLNAADSLSPDWGGSFAAIDKVARFAAEQTRETDGESMYARVYAYFTAYYGHRLAYAGFYDKEKARQGIKDLLARYPTVWSYNSLAQMSCLAEDFESYLDIVDQMESVSATQGWSYYRFYNDCAEAGLALLNN